MKKKKDERRSDGEKDEKTTSKISRKLDGYCITALQGAQTGQELCHAAPHHNKELGGYNTQHG